MKILEARYLISSPSIDKCPVPDRPEYAFIGRSNVGKSSLINMLTGNNKLAKTSNTPGKTQLINHFQLRSQQSPDAAAEDWYLVDLPGFGFAKRSKTTRDKWEMMTKNYILKRESLVRLFLLIDCRHSPQKIDLDFAAKMSEWDVAYTIIFTKSDKINQREAAKNVRLFSDALLKFQQFLPEMIITSSVKSRGREKILGLIQESNDIWYQNE